MERAYFDIETNGLLAEVSTVHAIVVADEEGTPEVYTDISAGLARLLEAEELVGHNIVSYDLPVLEKLHGFVWAGPVFDTLIASRLLHPGRYVHTLKSWGERLGTPKVEIETDYQTWTPEFEAYAVQDVVLGRSVAQDLDRHPFRSTPALKLETDFQRVAARMERDGFGFDETAARQVHAELVGELDGLYDSILEHVPSQLVFPTKQESFVPKSRNKRLGYYADAPITKIAITDFKPGAARHIATALERVHGWEPQELGKDGIAVVDATVLKGLPDWPVVPLLRAYKDIADQLEKLATGRTAYLKKVSSHTGSPRLHGSINGLGCITRRVSHSSPNIGQVPKRRAIRELFIPHPGHVLLGADLAGLELRLLGHYLHHWDGGAYGRELINGDVHQLTADRLDCTRPQAKTFAYATLYGAGPKGKSAHKMAADMDRPVSWVGKMLKQYIESVPGLAELTERLNESCAPHPKSRALSRIRALDGYPLVVRSKHAVVNTLLQAAGALCAKHWTVELDYLLDAELPDARIVAFVHDELQVSCPEGTVVGLTQAVRRATHSTTERFGLNVPLASECTVGLSWQETH